MTMFSNLKVGIVEESDLVELIGTLQSQTNATPPFFSAIEPINSEDEPYWFINLDQNGTISLRWSSPEDGSPILTDNIKVVELILYNEKMYDKYRSLFFSGRRVTVRGRIFPRITAHDHGDALIDVENICENN